MRVRHLIADVRGALRVSKISCELSEADLEIMVREAIADIDDRRRTHCIVECAVAKAVHACEEIVRDRDAAHRRPRRRGQRRRGKSEKRKAATL